MTDTIKIAVETLQARAKELIEDRDETRRRVLEEAVRNVQIERDIAGCVAGARSLGQEIDISSPNAIPQQKLAQLQQFQGLCLSLNNLYPFLKVEFGVQDDAVDEPEIDDSRPEMPRIADIIVERLQVAGEEGAKAADIRRFIRRTYQSDVHEKTVGMTLNRMQSAGQVRRDGRTWFLASVSIQPTTDSTKSNQGRS